MGAYGCYWKKKKEDLSRSKTADEKVSEGNFWVAQQVKNIEIFLENFSVTVIENFSLF